MDMDFNWNDGLIKLQYNENYKKGNINKENKNKTSNIDTLAFC